MGDVFAGRYELVDPLGEGGVGTVWRAWDHRSETFCAAKVLRQVDATSLLRFIREQSLRLDHPHVLAPTGWAGEDDKVLFTMPMIRGGSVSTLVGDFGPLPPRLVALLLDQLLAALEAIHAEGLVHRDVKPANLLLDATGWDHPQLWLGDFGIAAGVDEPRLTQGPFALGTPGYLAPECLHRGWDPDPRADLYSAGMCAVEMLLGIRPEDDTEAHAALTEGELHSPMPASLIDVVAGLAAPSLLLRTQAAADARRQLRDALLLSDGVPTEEILGEIEVFDQIPELPEGWTPEGPRGRGADQPSGAGATEPPGGVATGATGLVPHHRDPTRPVGQASDPQVQDRSQAQPQANSQSQPRSLAQPRPQGLPDTQWQVPPLSASSAPSGQQVQHQPAQHQPAQTQPAQHPPAQTQPAHYPRTPYTPQPYTSSPYTSPPTHSQGIPLVDSAPPHRRRLLLALAVGLLAAGLLVLIFTFWIVLS